MAYLIDGYDKWNKWDREHSLYIFDINEQEFAIKEVRLEWGIPQLPLHVDRDDESNTYFLYSSYEEALQFVRTMKSLNA